MGMTVTIDDDFHRQKHEAMAQLAEIRDGLEPSIREELHQIMLRVQQMAIELCPKDTGALAGSINLEFGAISAGDFADYQIYAGRDDIVNPKTGVPTSEYARLVHDGHLLRNGEFYEGVPFLDIAMMTFEQELEDAVNRAMSELGVKEPSASSVSDAEKVG